MKLCEQCREWILVDFYDSELNVENNQNLKKHLLDCAKCQQFARDVKAQVIHPFDHLEKKEVPASIWIAIEEKIKEEQNLQWARKNHFQSFFDHLLSWKLAPVYGTVFVLIMIFSFTIHMKQVKYIHDEEQAQYLISVMGSDVGMNETGSPDSDMSLEKYFL